MMVGLKKFFNVEKGASPRRPHTRHGEVSPVDNMSQLNRIDSHSYAQSTICPSPMTPSFPPELRSPRMLDMDHHFAGIERQFEELHEQFHSRPMSAISHCPSTVTVKTARHVDLVEAVFSSPHRYHMSSKSLSPAKPYNEDVADRNISGTPKKKPKRSRYAKILSALYQEDIADRNIASRGSSVSYAESRKSGNSSETEPTTRATSLASSQGWDRVSSKATIPGKRNSRILVTSSQEDLRRSAYSVDEDSVGHGQGTRRTPTGSLRSQSSTPSLVSKKQNPPPNTTGFGESNLLEVPGAFKYGGKMSNVPLPDSPTLPELRCYRPCVAINSTDFNQGCNPQNMDPLEISRAASKKNVRDLRINTQLASGRGPVKKIEHRAIQPPTPCQHLGTQSPSIAEIVNSPLPAATPSSISTPHSTYNAEEIMNMFRQAYVSTQAKTPIPTFETLQDAIVREINSHEAFRRVPIPDMGPPFTPPLTEDEFHPEPEVQTPATMHRNLAEKESQFTKLIRRGSQGRRRSKSISSLIHLTSYDKFGKRPETSGRRRRHTYAERPSAGLMDTMYPDQRPQGERPGGSAPYKTLLRGLSDSQVPLRSGPKTKSEPDLKHTPDQIPGVRSGSRNAPNMLQSRPSVVRRMRAQTTVSDGNNQTFFVDDDPDDIIELPHVELHPVQIKSVDDNNVTYFFNATAPIAPQESMSKWRTITQKVSSEGNRFSRKQSIPLAFSLNRKRIPLRRSSLNKDTPASRRMVW